MLFDKDSILETVERQSENFNFVDKIVSFIGNREFKKHYTDNTQRDDETGEVVFTDTNRGTDVWQTLYCVGDRFGEILYENVLDYIDNVSNVDTCRVRSLKSMMKMVDLNYEFANNIQYYPLEIQKVMDIFSINEKYLRDNKFIKQQLIDHMVDEGALLSTEHISPLSADELSADTVTYAVNTEKMDNFIYSVYFNLISSFIDSTYSDNEEDYAKNLISDYDHYFEKQSYNYKTIKYYDYKLVHNIDLSFDPVAIADKIDIGEDSLDNYTGSELELIKTEIQARSEETNHKGPTSKYAYYKLQKVLEYARFVDNTYSNINGTLGTQYKYDNNYIETSHETRKVINDDEERSINSDMIDQVVKVLLQVTKYIRKVRQQLKLQTKKVYMKGTNDLLIYTVNEFLIDYVNNFMTNNEHLSSTELSSAILDIRSQLSSHSPDSVDVIEYVDKTEYFNLQTETTKYSINKNTNPRFFDQYFSKSKNDKHVRQTKSPLEFTTDELTNFYLNTLNLKNELVPQVSAQTNSELAGCLYDYLSVLFDIGANTSYIFKDDDGNEVFGTRLANMDITSERHNDYLRTSHLVEYFNEQMKLCGYSYGGSGDISSQELEFHDKLQDYYIDVYLSAVSSNYNSVHDGLMNISSQNTSNRLELETMLSSTYSYYFCTSDYEICKDNGVYRYPYFFGNSMYDTEFFVERLNFLRDYVNDIQEEHIVNHPVIDTLNLTRSNYLKLRDEIRESVTNFIKLSGFNDLDLEELDIQIEQIQQFVSTRIQNRLQYLQQSLQDFKDQTQQLKNTYDQLENSFNQLVKNLPNAQSDTYFTFNSTKTGKYKRASKEGEDYTFDVFSGEWFKPLDDAEGYFDIGTFPSIESSASFDERITTAISIASTDFYQGSGRGAITTVSKDAFKSLTKTKNDLANSFNSIVKQLIELYKIDSNDLLKYYTDGTDSGASIEVKIMALMEFLSSKIDENNFRNDEVISSLYQHQNKLTELNTTYVKYNALYKNMWTDLSRFFDTFNSPVGDKMLYIIDNIDAASAYTTKQDLQNKDVINKEIDRFYQMYQQLDDGFRLICENEYVLRNGVEDSDFYVYEYSGDTIENMIFDFEDKLRLDIEYRTERGYRDVNEKLDEFCENFETYFVDITRKYLYPEYDNDKSLSLTGKNKRTFKVLMFSMQIYFMDKLKELYNELNYTSSQEYNETKELFQNYSGIETAYDPYYNHKNLTHPSYQIHPFMWNFTRSAIYTSLQLISKVVGNIAYDDLNDYIIVQKMDDYFGKYGNIKDIWKNNTVDNSGYVTRYEYSTHAHPDTGRYSEVVDYDGAFYPPAMEILRQPDGTKKCIEILSSNGDLDNYKGTAFEGFFERFYEHLELTREQLEMEINALSSSFGNDDVQYSIKDITNAHKLEDVYDIHKYFVDKYNNAYIFYKNYHQLNPSSDTKRNATGKLFVRLSNRPFAYPVEKVLNLTADHAFNGINGTELSAMHIIDVDMNEDGSMISLVFRDTNQHDYNAIHAYPLYIHYDKVDDVFKELMFSTVDMDSDNVYQTYEIPRLSSEIEDGTYSAYMGIYHTGKYDQNYVFIKRDKFSSSGEELSDIDFIYDGEIVQDDNNFVSALTYGSTTGIQSKPNVIEINTPTKIISRNAAFSYYVDDNSTKKLDFAFITENGDRYKSVSLDKSKDFCNIGNRLSVDFENNSIGPVIEDTMETEMNSHDIFNQTIYVSTIDVNTFKTGNGQNYNMNADIGFIPSYPGLSSNVELNLKKPIDERYQSVELLGMSKNMEEVIRRVNDKADPYIDRDYLYDNLLNGRVYEDFDRSYDKSMIFEKNPPMFQNMPSEGINEGNNYTKYISDDYGNNYFLWRYAIPSKIEDTQISDYKILIYNTTTLGRNPYAICDMKDVLSSDEYNLDKFYNNDNKLSSSEVEIEYDGKKYTASGTTNGINEQLGESDNRLFNISRITLKTSDQGRDILINFHLNDKDKNVYIEKGLLRLVLINPYELESFNFYHYIDANNVVKHKTYNGRIYGNCEYRDGWLSNFRVTKLSTTIDNQNVFDTQKNITFRKNFTVDIPIKTGNDVYTNQYVMSGYDRTYSLEMCIHDNKFRIGCPNDGSEEKHVIYTASDYRVMSNTMYWMRIICVNGKLGLYYSLNKRDYTELTLTADKPDINTDITVNQHVFFGCDYSERGSNFNNPFLGEIYILDTKITVGNKTEYVGYTKVSPFIPIPSTDKNEYGGIPGYNKIVYLSAIDFKDAKTFNDIYALSGYNRLAFKFSEDNFTESYSKGYFFPGINVAFPYTAGQFYMDYNPFVQYGYYELMNNQFNLSNIYVLDLQEAGLLSTFERVDVGIYGNQNDELRVYEDYLSATQEYDDTNVRYCMDDPKLYQYVHFVTTSSDRNDIDVGDVEQLPMSEFSDRIQQLGLSCTKSESSDSEDSGNEIDYFIPEKSTLYGRYKELDKFLKLYFTYEKEDGQITIMVNYNNFINSPFVKLNDEGKVVSDVIQGTYAKIKTGESKVIDVMIQFKYYNGDKLYGYNNIIFATYDIINISDDKPKFIIRRTNKITPQDAVIRNIEYVKIIGERKTVDISTSTSKEFTYNVNVSYNGDFDEVTFTLIHPYGIELDSADNSHIIGHTNNTIDIKLDKSYKSIGIPFKVNIDQFPRNRYDVINSMVISKVRYNGKSELQTRNGQLIVKGE